MYRFMTGIGAELDWVAPSLPPHAARSDTSEQPGIAQPRTARTGYASVVINAAGRGSRLGHQVPKSLVSVAGRSVLHWQLTEVCRSAHDISIVVGYMADDVAALARSIRRDIRVITNERWAVTKTGGSLSLAAAQIAGRCLSLDGDLLVAPADFEKLLAMTSDAIGICAPTSSQPVYAELDRRLDCRGFSCSAPTLWEWTGLVNFDPQQIVFSDGHVYQMVQSILPVKTVDVRCVEIDTPADLAVADRMWPRILNSLP